jgi:WD40 repeat protein
MVRTFKTGPGWTWSLAITADGRRAVSAGGDWTVRVWDLESAGVTATFTGDGRMLGL